MLVLINVTGNARGSREAQGGWHLGVSLGGTASSDNLAVNLTSSNVYTTPSMKSGISPNPEGTESFVKTAGSPTHKALNWRDRRDRGLPPRARENSFNDFCEMIRSLLPPPFLSPPPPNFTFYYPLHCFIQVYILRYVLCCHFSFLNIFIGV